MHEIIRLDDATVIFLKSAAETHGQFSLCEFIIPPHGTVLLPHRHAEFDQLVLGMNATTLWTLGDEHTSVGPGERLFIPRGTPHSFINKDETPARFACIFTPALIGPEFFREVAAVSHLPASLRELELSLVLHRFRITPVGTAGSH